MVGMEIVDWWSHVTLLCQCRLPQFPSAQTASGSDHPWSSAKASHLGGHTAICVRLITLEGSCSSYSPTHFKKQTSFYRSFRLWAKVSRRYRDFPRAPCFHTCTLTPLSTSPPEQDSCYNGWPYTDAYLGFGLTCLHAMLLGMWKLKPIFTFPLLYFFVEWASLSKT